MKLLRLILLLLPLLSFSQGTYYRSKISKETLKVVREIKKFPFLSLHTIENEAPVTSYSYFKDLYNTATPQELIELTNHPDSKVRCYAFSCLAIASRDSIFSIIKSHLNDDEIVRTQAIYYIPERGAEGHRDAIMVGDYFIQVATDTFRKQPILTNMQLHELDSLIVHSKTNLRYRKEVVDKLLKSNIKPLIDNQPSPVAYIKGYNTLYRGIENNLIITVPGSKSFKVSAPGLVKAGGKDDYRFNVSKIKENRVVVDYEVITQSDSIVKYQDLYFIENIKPYKALINGRGCEKCIVEMAKSEFKDAKISVKAGVQFSPFNLVYLRSFTIVLPDNKEYRIKGDTITDIISDKIIKYSKNSSVFIKDFDYYVPGICSYDPIVAPIKIQLVD
ncbi:hypothetical protein FMM05_10885 [Flavobacterium zepuense]|uniref:HEAT repeat domain-containing protein n=1 Tax=Flavobacterium zepuense TaxID=2593302 RepID=A0A552V1I6_9FLAO|nr:hypothetical protein [Flavobacterium zepuense]TRW24328.1 hypothetical protein FMM05_10885 [Flavobacterium zepuense]